MRRAYKFLLRPTSKQATPLQAVLDDHRHLYNAALEERREAYRKQKVSIRYGDQSAQLKDIRKADPQTRVYLQGVGHVRVHAHRKVNGRVKTVSVKREGRRWYVVLACDDVPALALPETGRTVGIDMGVVSFLTTSTGERIDNPRRGRGHAARLANAQRDLARCKRGSNRRRKQVARVAALHGKVRRQRLDHAHKTARWLVGHHDVIAHEALRIGNMTRSASGTVAEPGTNVAQKSGLNRSILDAGWGVFLNVLRAKAESAGRVVVAGCHRTDRPPTDHRPPTDDARRTGHPGIR